MQVNTPSDFLLNPICISCLCLSKSILKYMEFIQIKYCLHQSAKMNCFLFLDFFVSCESSAREKKAWHFMRQQTIHTKFQALLSM